MKAPLSWLRDFAPIEGSTADLADVLNRIGLIVEGISEPGREVGGVVTVRVEAVEKHPDADRLVLVDIDTGSGSARVVCGASNFAPGDVVPWAAPGASLPGGFQISQRRIRGQVSDGMLASGRELGISDDHEGILILPAETGLGLDVRDALGLDDVIFDLEITPNRPDAMSVAGVARDLAAALGVPFTLSTPSVAETGPAVGDLATLAVEAPDRCPRYVARVGRVGMGPAPQWMAQRLVKAGLRPISNVVDVTNYVLLERGQPLHAFDLGLLGGRGIVVRLAGEGERITTLDGVERILTRDDLLICDAERVPQAVAGVMGGGGSEVSDATTEVLLESAYFTPEGILRTSKRLGLRTESSARFERGVDPNGVGAAADRAWELFAQVAEGQAAAGVLDAYPQPVEPARIRLRTERVNDILGTDLDTGRVLGYLEPLGLAADPLVPERLVVDAPASEPGQPEAISTDEFADLRDALAPAFGSGGDEIEFVVPTFRPDLEREIDLIEEVARHHGYNNITRTLPRRAEPGAGLTAFQLDRRLVREALLGAGLDEATTFSLLSPADLAAAGFPAEGIELENPLRAEESLLRPALLPGLLRAVAFNAGHGQANVSLFEVGHVFLPPPPDQTLPDEREKLAGVLAGSVRRLPHEADRPVDGHDAVGVLDAVARVLEVEGWHLAPGDGPGFAPGRAAAVMIGDDVCGLVGEVDPEVLNRLGVSGTVAAFEIDLSTLLGAPRKERRFVAPSRFPSSSVDLAFVVAEDLPAGTAEATLRQAAGEWCEEVRLFDVFRSGALGEGRKSLAFTLRFRAPDRTLTDADVGAVRERCIQAMAAAHGATLRG
jgi:phenylalanyl-tRNA synthetase beta chain